MALGRPSMALLAARAALVLLLPLAFPQGAFRCCENKVLLVTEGEPVSIACPFHKHCGKADFHEIIWSYKKDSRRILQFRETPPKDTSTVIRQDGHFRGELDFGRCVSFLNISAVLLNDSGRYLCYVKVGHSDSSSEVTHLLVRGQQPRATPEGLLRAAPEGSEVTLDCDFSTNVTNNFTELFWLHEPEEGPVRLIAWHHEPGCPGGISAGQRFQSATDLENQWSYLTISGLQRSDSGWYWCERLGQLSGWQRRATKLTVKGSLTVLLAALGSAGFALATSCLYFQCCSYRAVRPRCCTSDKQPVCVQRPDTPETPDPALEPAETPGQLLETPLEATEERAGEPAGSTATYASLSSEYSLLHLVRTGPQHLKPGTQVTSQEAQGELLVSCA